MEFPPMIEPDDDGFPCGFYLKLADMICGVRLPENMRSHPVRVAIDGVDASGKTTLADRLVPLIEKHHIPVIRATIDGFHNPQQIRYQRGVESPEGYYYDSFNYEVLKRDLLIPLGPDGDRCCRLAVFNWEDDVPSDGAWYKAPKNAVLLFDGVFLLRPELIQYWDFSIFLAVDFCISVSRAVQRDIASGDQKWNADILQMRYKRRYVPGQQLYLREAMPQEQASIIVDNNDYQNPSIIPK
jgi:uridine kinase